MALARFISRPGRRWTIARVATLAGLTGAMAIAAFIPASPADAAVSHSPTYAYTTVGYTPTQVGHAVGVVLSVGRGHELRETAAVSREPLWEYNIPCPVSCGISSSGGVHLWVIASYQQIANATVMTAVLGACVVYASPWIDPIAAAALCGVAVYLLKALEANEPRVSNHGAWVAGYFSSRGVTGGRY